MAYLSFSFLGGFEVVIDAEPVSAFGTIKARALLAYLAVESSRPHRRDKLAAMFWPDLPTKSAAHNLSQNLLRLRKALQEQKESASPLLFVTPQEVQFNSYSGLHLDVIRFRELLNLASQHNHPEAASCGDCAQWLSQAAELYRGDFLAGLFIPDSIPFEEWRLIQQESLHQQAVEALSWLAVYNEQQGEYEQVKMYARRQIALEPWREEAHFQLMLALANSGQSAAALRQFEQYRGTLAVELGIQPAAAATRLYEKIRSGETEKETVRQPIAQESVWLSEQGEHRQITALVCHLGIQEDGEEIRDHIALCEQYCQGIYRRFGGQRTPRQGSACLVYFGYPQAYEDSARRAVHASLALADAVAGNESVRIGIHTGKMVAGKKRGGRWQDRDLMGTAVEIARTCQQQANPGEILITQDTRLLVQESFDLQLVEKEISGTSGKVMQLFQVRGEESLQSRLEWLAETQRLTAFTGRTKEMNALRSWEDRVRKGEGQVVFLRGEPGIGKSRLIWELKKNTLAVEASDIDTPINPIDDASILWLSGRCLPHFQNTNLYPVIELIEQLLGFRTEDSLEIRRDKLASVLTRYHLDRPSAVWLFSILLGLLTEETAPETMTKAHREQMRLLFLALLQKRAGERPLCIQIEDLHWCDPSTLDWLSQSLPALTRMPCLTLLTARSSFNPSWLSQEGLKSSINQIYLQPLLPKQAEHIVTALVGDSPLEMEMVQHIINQTDGNPLFIEELTKTVLGHPTLQDQSDKPSKIPTTLHDSLMTRLDHLGRAKETAHWAAVIGREFFYPILQACTSFDEHRLQSDLARLIETELIAPVSGTTLNNPAFARYVFKHALIQETAYASLVQRTRQTFHRRTAEVMEGQFTQLAETQPELLAQHYDLARMGTKAAVFWLRAGERAAAQGATLEARTFFNRALAGIEPTNLEQRWQALLGREAVHNLREERQTQKEDIDALLELAEAFDDDTRRAQALMRQAGYALRQKEFALMLETNKTAIAAAKRAGNRVLEVQALTGQVTALAYTGDWSAAQRTVEQTLEKLPEVADDVVRAYVLGDMGFYYGRVGDLSRALTLMQQGVEAAHRVGNRQKESRLLLNIGFVNAQLGRFTEAITAFETGLLLAEAIGDQALQTSHNYNLSYALWFGGNREKGLLTGEAALQEFKIAGHNTIGHACCLAYLGIYLLEAGDLAAAADYLAQARMMYVTIGVNAIRFEAQAVEAYCLLMLGQYWEAQQLAIEVWEYVQKQGNGGMDFPSRAYLCLAGVFDTIQTAGLTPKYVVELGYQDLMQRAEKISDIAWRWSFLENAPENKKLAAQWEKICEADTSL